MPGILTPFLLALALPANLPAQTKALELTSAQFLTPTYREKFVGEWVALASAEQSLDRNAQALALADWLKPAVVKAQNWDRNALLLVEARACTVLKLRDPKFARDCEAPLREGWKLADRLDPVNAFYFRQDLTVAGVRAARGESALRQWLKKGETLKTENAQQRETLLSMLYGARADWHSYRSYGEGAWVRQPVADGESDAWLKYQQSQFPGLQRLPQPVLAGPIRLETNEELKVILNRLAWQADMMANASFVLDAEFLLDSMSAAAELAGAAERADFLERRFSVALAWGTRKQARAVVEQWLKISTLPPVKRMTALLALAEVSSDSPERENSLKQVIATAAQVNAEDDFSRDQDLLRAHALLAELYGEQGRQEDLLREADAAFALAKRQDARFAGSQNPPAVPGSAFDLARVRGLAAWAYLSQGKFREAEPILREAAKYVGAVKEGATLVYFGLAAVEHAAGRSELALSYLRTGETTVGRRPASSSGDGDRRFASAVRRYLKSGNAVDLGWN